MDPVLQFLSGENLTSGVWGSSRPLQAGAGTWGGQDGGEAGSQLRGIPGGSPDPPDHLWMFSLSQAVCEVLMHISNLYKTPLETRTPTGSGSHSYELLD